MQRYAYTGLWGNVFTCIPATLFVRSDNDRFRLEDKGLYLFANKGGEANDSNKFTINPSENPLSSNC